MSQPEFLSFEIVCLFHSRSISRYGGTHGVRDKGMVESALAAAENVYWIGEGDLFAIAAAYAFHIAEAQAFLDGNKRTAVAAALAFIRGNGGACLEDDGRIYEAMIAIANKQLDKTGLAQLLRRMAGEQSQP